MCQSYSYISLQSTGLHHPFCDMQAYCLLLGCSVYYWSSFAVSEGTQQQARNVPSGTLRKILRAIRDVPAEADRHYLKDWAREEFRRNKDATEEVRSGTRNPERLPSGTIGAVSSLLCDGVLFCRCHFWTGCNQDDDYSRQHATSGTSKNT
ncbi:LYR motif-containing protein 2 isoform X2 [Aquila chrysaetos chrysaetos]|uniref:LYR motif-containing protein 2 isoform X2 n=1 Tax=Aquila chrysaetos chrysaetos TaxID=223781 RepID=UPI001B7D4304|nr:LYR motif-containing protein 2 isoform X2 [Aquila chrysaetos chrysaetos]